MTTEQTYQIVAWIDGVHYAVKPIVHVRRIAAVALVAASLNVHAASNSQGPHGGIAAARGLAASHASSHMGAAQSANGNGNGGPAHSVVDDFQPWPESEMRQYQKPHWAPYTGE